MSPPGSMGQGIGAALMTHLLALLEARGIRHVMAVIGDSDNTGSIIITSSHWGSRTWAPCAGCGWKFERWLDIVLMERTLGKGTQTAPTDSDAA